MVVKMMKWSPWPTVSAAKKFQVKVKPMKLEGFFHGFDESEEEKGEKILMVEMRWKGPKAGLVSLHRSSKQRRNVSTERILGKNDQIEWDDEFENVCSFSIFQKDASFQPWDVSLNLLYGQRGEPKTKFTVIGKVLLNIAELASQAESQIERNLPINLQIAGVAREATLLISVSFVEIRNNSQEIVLEPNMPEKDDGFLTKVEGFGSKYKKKNNAGEERFSDGNSGDTDESTTFDSEGSPDNDLGTTQNDSITPPAECLIEAKGEDESSVYYDDDRSDKEASLLTQSVLSSKSETLFDSASKAGFWRKRRLSFRFDKKKDEPLVKKTSIDNIIDRPNCDHSALSIEEANESLEPTSSSSSSKSSLGEDELWVSGSWEYKELISRDGEAKLKANVFFASIDQRSEKAAGESACTAIVAVIADWLQSNRDKMPARSMFDSLITEGASEWRKLCGNEAYIQRFPDKHFDLETVLEANPRSLSIIHDKSFVGFFYPERFETLKEAMSFDGIWDHISSNVKEGQAAEIYIISWNDHFFVLKVEVDAYYVIDTLGERLFEGCNEAYILKFDNSTKLYSSSQEQVVVDGLEDMTKVDMEHSEGDHRNDHGENKSERLVCSGKDCCREFIKRFLAAIPLRELEMEEKKGTVSSIHLHQRLQIEFHFSSTISSSSS